MRNADAFRSARRAGSINNVSQIFGAAFEGQIFRALLRQLLRIRVETENQQGRVIPPQRLKLRRAQQHPRTRIFKHERQTLLRISGV